jgi:DNA-binding response OmpR family regulator
MKILVAEDDQNILNGLCEIMENEGFETIKAKNGQEALILYKEHTPDFVCLDIMMPEMSGYDVCRGIRKTDAHIPIIFISAKEEEIDRVLGLELGADDYITKPFGMREVIARIRTVTKRCIQNSQPQKIDNCFTMNDLKVYPQQLRAVHAQNNQDIDLSLREVKILQILYNHKNDVISRDMLLDACWGEHIMPESRTVDQHIANLRKKIETNPKEPRIIRTVQGVGYRFHE